MDSLPLFLNLTGKPVLVVGGGDVALRKVQTLLKAGARITLVAPEVNDSLTALASKQLRIINSDYQPWHIEGQRLVIAATDDNQLNQQVSDACEAADIWVNVVDQPELCGFTFPSIIDRSPLMIAISTGGKAPVLGRLWKEKLETLIPSWTGKLAQVAGEFRQEVKSKIASFQSRRHFWERVFRGPASQAAAQNDWPRVQQSLAQELEKSEQSLTPTTSKVRGQVYLVGGGPGDPDLLTIKALQTMQMADVIVYDYLISDEILNLCRKDADMISVGKKAGNHTLPQDKINQLLVDLAQEGKIVCRLKGGDPYIFGRGGEEAQLLAQNKVPYQVVPGITAAAACSASSGIPLTHRDYAQSLQFVTGHCKNSDAVAGAKGNGLSQNNCENNGPNWRSLATSNQTLVVYMGVIRSAVIRENLIANGRAPETPIAIIEKGTRPDQRVVTGQLSELDTLANVNKIGSPALIIIGEVVALHKELYVPTGAESQIVPLKSSATDVAETTTSNSQSAA